MTHQTTRRKFLQRSGETATLAAIGSTLPAVHTFGAPVDQTVNLGIIGCGGMMTGTCEGTGRSARGRIVRLAVRRRRQANRQDVRHRFASFSRLPPKRTSRYEDVVADTTLTPCIIATPHHWHAPIAVARNADGQGRLHREADLARLQRRTADDRSRQEIRPRGAAGKPDAHVAPLPRKAGKLLADGIIGEVKVARAWTAEVRTKS